MNTKDTTATTDNHYNLDIDKHNEAASRNSFLSTLGESTIILAMCSAVLYMWGFCYDAFSFVYLGVPLEFFPEQEIQDHILEGGMIGLTFFFQLFLYHT